MVLQESPLPPTSNSFNTRTQEDERADRSPVSNWTIFPDRARRTVPIPVDLPSVAHMRTNNPSDGLQESINLRNSAHHFSTSNSETFQNTTPQFTRAGSPVYSLTRHQEIQVSQTFRSITPGDTSPFFAQRTDSRNGIQPLEAAQGNLNLNIRRPRDGSTPEFRSPGDKIQVGPHSQGLGQQSPDNDLDPFQELLTAKISATATQLTLSATPREDTSPEGSHKPPPLTEGTETQTPYSAKSMRFSNHDQRSGSFPHPGSSGTKRKRGSTPDTFDSSSGSSKRQSTGERRGPLQGQKKILPKVVLDPFALPPGRLGLSDTTTPYGLTQPQKIEPIIAGRTPSGTLLGSPVKISAAYSDTKQKESAIFFPNASNLVFNDSQMIGTQYVYVQADRSEDALRWLKEYTMQGAEHDSSARDPPPRCHPGTRTTIIQKVHDWLEISPREKQLLWLRGPAGVGKSAIVQTLAEKLSMTRRLGASLFFSRPNGRTNPSQVFPTLAYRFAVQDPAYKIYITELMLADLKILEKSIREQFEILIVEPFIYEKIRNGSEPWVVTLDGLDECGGDTHGGRHSDRVQADIVRLISDFVLQYPSAPITWIVASRPETHLKAVFSEEDVVPSFWEENVPVDSDEACRDVEKFLHKEFMKIRQNYPDYIHESPWPNSDHFLKIAHAALGLFIFAQVIIRFIDDPAVGNPIGQLRVVLSAISQVPLASRENPLAILDAIYMEILSRIPSGVLQITKALVGSCIVLDAAGVRDSDWDLRLTCNLLQITRDVAITGLRYLHSVLDFPTFKDIGQTRPHFYHASFRDFLEDASRSQNYHIEKPPIVADLFLGVIRVAQLQFSSRPATPFSWPGEQPAGPPSRPIVEGLCNVFKGDISSRGVSVLFYNMKCFLPDSQLQQLLEDLDGVKLMHYGWKFLGALIDIPFLSTSRPKENMLDELKLRGFLSQVTYGSLSINWDSLSISITRQHEWVRVIHVYEGGEVGYVAGTADEDIQAVQELRLCCLTAPQLIVTVLGHKEFERCVMIERGDLRKFWTGVTPPIHCIITGAL